ncbi:MAG: sulfatase [Eubacteriales bacterium]|jgi:arylsulfatase A-like enzyme
MQRNILLITTDTHRVDALKCMGSSFAHSPCIDKLASEGVMFTQAHSVAPVCMPARCSIMTGLHTPLHGCIENGVERWDIPFFTDTLKDMGYVCLMSGKTHFGPMPDSFEKYAPMPRGNHGRLDPVKQIIADKVVEEEEHPDSLVVTNLFNMIDEVREEGDKPFFAFCSINAPHQPLDPPGKWANFFKPEDIPKLNYQEGEPYNLPEHLRYLLGLDPDSEIPGRSIDSLSLEKIREVRAKYFSLCAFVDHLIGKIVDGIDERGLKENTLIIFTSDHGQEYYDHGFNDKHNYFDKSMRVPFILRMPGTLPEGETRKYSLTTDIMPTILGAAGVQTDFANGFDLFSPLVNKEDNPRKCAVASVFRSMAVVTDRWKLEYYYDDDDVRLYNRISDPDESQNLAQDPNYSSVRDKLLIALLRWRTELTDVRDLRQRLVEMGPGRAGPVARRSINRLKTINGRQSEINLQNKVCIL